MKKDLTKVKAIYDFMCQWFDDFTYAIERNPIDYELNVYRVPTKYGMRTITSISDTTGHVGEAICNEEKDVYNFRLGVAIAWAKLHRISLPRELRPEIMIDICKLRPGDYFIDKNGSDSVYKILTKTRNTDNSDIVITVYDETYKGYDIYSIKEKDKDLVVLA